MNLFQKFKNSVTTYPDKPALVIGDSSYTYKQLFDKSMQVAYLLLNNSKGRIGIFASKSLTAYTGLLGAVASGITFVPLSGELPISRNQTMMDLAGIKSLMVDQPGLKQILKIKDELPSETIIICPEIDSNDIPPSLEKKFKLFSKSDLNKPLSEIVQVSPEKILYIVFTSGSTGTPKMVPTSHGNLFPIFEFYANSAIFNIGPGDRVVHWSPLMFTISRVELFIGWFSGAAIYPIEEKIIQNHIRFIRENKISFWIISPSEFRALRQFNLLPENSFPDLRYLTFDGEPFPKSLLDPVKKAAPNVLIQLSYGSSETSQISLYQLPENRQDVQSYNGIISMGPVIETLNYCLIDEDGKKVNDTGELCLSGPTVFQGYLNRPKENKKLFFKFPNNSRRWFKTGDIIKQERKRFYYVNRKDFMVKIRGTRVNVEEINFLIKKFTKAEIVYTLPYPLQNNRADYLYVFMDGEGMTDKRKIFYHLKNRLMSYMLPKAIIILDKFPLNPNGKIDRKQLIKQIKKFERN